MNDVEDVLDDNDNDEETDDINDNADAEAVNGESFNEESDDVCDICRF